MKKSFYILLLPLLCFLLGGCSKDNYTYPSVITELADLHTDSNGKISLLINDNNQEWQLVTSIQETYPADTGHSACTNHWKQTIKVEKQSFIHQRQFSLLLPFPWRA